MPILFGSYISSASYDPVTQYVTCVGEGFGDEIALSSDIQVSPSRVPSWTTTQYNTLSWTDTVVSGYMLNPLLDNVTYDVRVVTADNFMTTPLYGAFGVGDAAEAAFRIDISQNWNYINETYVLVDSEWIKPSTCFVLRNGEWRYHY